MKQTRMPLVPGSLRAAAVAGAVLSAAAAVPAGADGFAGSGSCAAAPPPSPAAGSEDAKKAHRPIGAVLGRERDLGPGVDPAVREAGRGRVGGAAQVAVADAVEGMGLPLLRVGTLIATPLNCLMTLADGPIETLSDLKGKGVLLDFWFLA